MIEIYLTEQKCLCFILIPSSKLGSWMMLVMCIGCCVASCNCCSKDVTSYPCVQSRFSGLSHLGLFPALSDSAVPVHRWLQCSGSVPPACPVLPYGDDMFWDLLFVESALWVPLLWEDSWSVPCVSTFLGWLSHVPVALLPALAWARWLMAPAKNLTFLEPPTTGTESQRMCNSDWIRWKTGSVI